MDMEKVFVYWNKYSHREWVEVKGLVLLMYTIQGKNDHNWIILKVLPTSKKLDLLIKSFHNGYRKGFFMLEEI